jgi:hypothetical protein
LGLTNEALAALFNVDYGTIKTHLHNLLGKLLCTDRTQLAACFERALLPSLVSPESRPAPARQPPSRQRRPPQRGLVGRSGS